ncbi:BTB POZ domain protein [Rutstroemia sp. NJR-2017a WRK4]|nr:BTB POZ domain protein [Rutstroemia sp. NJR-2017a WRK4]
MSEDIEASRNTLVGEVFAEDSRRSSQNQLGQGNLQLNAEEEIILEGPLEALQSSLHSGRYSDLTIIHGSRQWKAHKVVICSQSPVLESMMDAQAQKSSKPPNTLDLTSLPHEATTALIQYLYTSAYQNSSNPLYLSAPAFSLYFHESVFHLSVTLQIPGLEVLAAAAYGHTLNTQVTSLPVYFGVIPKIYEMTTKKHPGLRNAVVDVAVKGIGELLADAELRRAFWRVCTEVEEFWEEVLRGLIRSKEVLVGLGTVGEGVESLVCDRCEEGGQGQEQQGFDIQVLCKGCGEVSGVEFA